MHLVRRLGEGETMRCPHCQREIAEESNYCYYCGARQHRPINTGGPAKRLMRSSTDVKIAGVCAGFAEYFGWDPTLVRLGWVVITIFPMPFLGVVAYIVAWLVMPIAPLPLPAAAPAQAPSAEPARSV